MQGHLKDIAGNKMQSPSAGKTLSADGAVKEAKELCTGAATLAKWAMDHPI
jgi:hypothetical protein